MFKYMKRLFKKKQTVYTTDEVLGILDSIQKHYDRSAFAAIDQYSENGVEKIKVVSHEYVSVVLSDYSYEIQLTDNRNV